jgi:L-alanine-DL-glutamate epimerase-like enolase superfamily enzyme
MSDTITKIEVWPIDLPLTDPFVVATGRRLAAENLFVRVTLRGGARGYGEVAPFPEVGGGDRDTAQRALMTLAQEALGGRAMEYRRLARLFHDIAPDQPAARCGLETAFLDALCRDRNIPLWGFWGGADVRERETDITIPIADLDRTVALGREWHARGFRLFKTKVGGDLDEDVRRVTALHHDLTGAGFIVDANQGFTVEQCRAFMKEVRRCGARVVLLEQPVPRDDLAGLAALRRDLGIPVAADESARSLEDARRVAEARAADVLNIKITKSGVLEAIEIAMFARAHGLRLMIGGMVETRVAMGCSFSLVLGLGGFDFLDLDTPLLMASDPVEGGYTYEGPRLRPCASPGLGVELALPASVTTIA